MIPKIIVYLIQTIKLGIKRTLWSSNKTNKYNMKTALRQKRWQTPRRKASWIKLASFNLTQYSLLALHRPSQIRFEQYYTFNNTVSSGLIFAKNSTLLKLNCTQQPLATSNIYNLAYRQLLWTFIFQITTALVFYLLPGDIESSQ